MRTCFDEGMKENAKADALESRLIKFAGDIMTLVSQLPKTPQGKHIASQILRSGTAAAPNYAEARGAESRADFIHKLRIALKELNETSIWLRVIQRGFEISPDTLSALVAENTELCRILVASVQTAKRKMTIDE